MTGEQRYRQAMTKARLIGAQNMRAFLAGEQPTSGEPLFDIERRLLIEELDRAADLLEALEECLREHGGYTIRGECERRARAALKRAKGE